MTRKDSFTETLYGLIGGSIYGAVYTLSGHPLDTIKTRLQTRQYINMRGLYKGVLPSLIGSTFYRSIQFAVYEGAYTFMKNNNIMQQPTILGLQKSTILSGIIASGCRAVLESPAEYYKVNKQLDTKTKYNNMYNGFKYQYLRTTGLMTTYFCTIDLLRQNTMLFTSISGQFIASAGAATLGYWIVWPLEVLKNQHQSGKLYKNIKVRDLYKGILPGTLSIFWANGCAMIAMELIRHKLHVHNKNE